MQPYIDGQSLRREGHDDRVLMMMVKVVTLHMPIRKRERGYLVRLQTRGTT
jgi:hypothetical protein